MDPLAIIARLKQHPSYHGQISHIEHIPPRQPCYGEPNPPLPPSLERRLRERGLFPLYRHQVEALSLIRQGKNVIVTAPSAGGKTLCYNLPVLETLVTQKGTTALYIFPTKALSQDQCRVFRELACPALFPSEEIGIFDGDTPSEERAALKRRARIIITNPDMLHLGVLPNHNTWARFLRQLKFVVVDEAHAYRGVFGSHVSNVLRRLRRVCALYGARPQFILASATLANPREHAESLTGLPFEVVSGEGSPQSGRDFVFWNPPLIASGVRRSSSSEVSFILAELIKQGIRTMAFAPTRKLTELIHIYTRDRLARECPGLERKIRPYRAGYLPELRREIERELFYGELLGVVTTTALELGVDIGEMDVTLLSGYPGSIFSTWQQAGRSGRRGRRALSILVASDNPLDQYLMHHPEAFFSRPMEHALINPQNPNILKLHLLCAAWECPLRPEEKDLFGDAIEPLLQELTAEGYLRERRGKYFLAPTVFYPAQDVNLRTATEKPFTIIDLSSGRTLETVEAAMAYIQIHPGAIYIHQGETYLIRELDIISRTAYAVPCEVDYYTQARELTEVRIKNIWKVREKGKVRIYLGEVEVTRWVIGFKKKRQYTEETIGEEALDLPPYVFPTVALWFDLPPGVAGRLEVCSLDFAGGLHGLEHAAIALLPLFALCDRNDIGGLSTTMHPDTGQPQVFIYDAYPGGVGISEKGFEIIEELWKATLKAISECPCENGCPSCIQSPKCGNNNQPLDKQAAIFILRELATDEIPTPVC